MDIRERFQRPEWLSRREAEIERAEGMCESCEATGELEVLVPFLSASRNPWDYPEGSYRVFCPSCMQSHRTLESRAREALSQLGTPELESLFNTLLLVLEVPAAERAGSVERLYAAARRERETQAGYPEDVY
jgi:hypothetical protein